MSYDTLHVIAYAISYGLSALVLGWLATRKNRDGWTWGLIGGFFCLPCLIALACLPYLCPKCKRPLTNREWERRECPTCGGPSAEPTVCLSCGAVIPGDATACPQCGWSYESGA